MVCLAVRQSQRRRLSFDQGSSSTVASVGDAPSVTTGVASVATKDTVDRSLPVTLESLADLLVTIQSGQERTAARVASIDDHLTSISLTLEGLALNQRKLEKAIQAVTEKSTQTARSLKETKRDTELVTDHVRNLDVAMASLHDTLIEVRRDAEVTFMISSLEETDGENVVDKVKSVVKELCMADAENIVAADRVGSAKPRHGGVNSKGAPSSRIIRVRMSSAVACRRILRARFALKSLSPPRNRIFITEDLTHSERMRKSELLPVYKELKARKVKQCRLDRDRLVVGELVLRSGSAARAFLQQQLTEMDHGRASDVSVAADSGSTPPHPREAKDLLGNQSKNDRTIPLLTASCSQDNALSMMLYTLNVNGLIGKFQEIQNLLVTDQPHLVCLTETKLSADVDDNLISIPGYSIVRRDRNNHGGGVAIYYKTDLKVTRSDFTELKGEVRAICRF